MKLSILFLAIGLLGSNFAAPLEDGVCVTAEEVKFVLSNTLDEQLGKKFSKDFEEAYDNTMKVSRRPTSGCFVESDFNFICNTLNVLYKKRVPKAAIEVNRDCNEVGHAIYH